MKKKHVEIHPFIYLGYWQKHITVAIFFKPPCVFYHGSIRVVDWDKTLVDWPMLTPVTMSRSHIPDDIPEFNAPLERNPDDAPPSWILS